MKPDGKQQFFIDGKWQSTIDLYNNYPHRNTYWSNKKQMDYTLKPIKLRRYDGISKGDIVTIQTKYLPYPKSKVVKSYHSIYYFDDGTKAFNTTVMTESGNKYSTFEDEILYIEKAKENRK